MYEVKKPIVLRIDAAQRAQIQTITQRAEEDRKTADYRSDRYRYQRWTVSEVMREALRIGLAELAKKYPAAKRPKPTPAAKGRR